MKLKNILLISCLSLFILGTGFFAAEVDAFPQRELPSQAQGPDLQKMKEQFDSMIDRMDNLPEQARAQERIIELRKKLKKYRSLLEEMAPTPREWCYNFENDLRIDDEGEDVEMLHKALKEEGFSTAADESSFSLITASSVVGFQQKYEEDILHSLDLPYGTGFVGSVTRDKLNELYGCKEDVELSCADDVEKAQEYAEGRMCTDEIATMECPREEDYTYEAINGCEISFLEERGWERVAQLDNVLQSITVETEKETYSSDEDIEIAIIVEGEGTLDFNTGCQATYRIGDFDLEDGRVCTMALSSADLPEVWILVHDLNENPLGKGYHTLNASLVGYDEEDSIEIEIE